jgi:hypothetical protein
MLFKGSNNLVQIYRSFAITGNYGRQSFSKYARNGAAAEIFCARLEFLTPAFINNKT